MEQISFLINTSINTRGHVELLIKSLKENLTGKEHEILVFVDSDNEGTVDWLRDQKKDFYDLKIITHRLNPCVGYSRNNNLLVELAKHDIVSYLQSDMVISPGYDEDILKNLEDNCILSATRIEPPLHGTSPVTVTKDLGVDPEDFNWEEFQRFSVSAKEVRETQYFFAPFTFYKKVWLDVGGYDTVFRRSREDSDLLQRFVQKGVKIKQTFGANVYHFSCVSSRGKNWFDQNNQEAQQRVQLQNFADRIELARFVRKWGRFTHEIEKLKKLDIDLVVLHQFPERLNILLQLEPYFTKVWVESEEEKNALLEIHQHEHTAANQLLKFSEQDWEYAKQFYNQVDYSERIHVGTPETFKIKVTLDPTKVESQADPFFNNVYLLNDILCQEEEGVYQLGAATIEIREIVDLAENQIVVSNPPFDYSLLSIE